jgi:hypothetical protein
MAICSACDQEMLTAQSCTHVFAKTASGTPMRRIPYGLSAGWDDDDVVARRCHDCGVGKGGIHHPGCDMERCPSCHRQMIGCGCFDGTDDNGDPEPIIVPPDLVAA